MGDIARRVGALALAAAFAAGGCSKVETGVVPLGSAARPGVVRIVGTGTIDNLVPELAGNATSEDIAMFWGAWLYLADSKGRLVPELATDIPSPANDGISRDGLTITYHLRRGVTWQDGAPFDARDVIFSWHAIMNSRNNVQTRTGYDQIASMSAPDRYTLKVVLRRPYGPAIATFFAPSQSPMCILPAHLLAALPDINRAAYDSKPVGTGPFVVARYEPGNKVVLKPNPHYWRGPPKLSEVDFLLVSDPNTRMIMMRTGEADLYFEPPEYQAPSLRTIPGVHLVEVPFNNFWYLAFNESHPPLDDLRVRRAVAMGVDRDYLIRTVMNGVGAPADGDQAAYSWAFDPTLKGPGYDFAAAARALDNAGWRADAEGHRSKNGNRLALTYVTSQGYGDAVRFAPIFQSEMARLGIDVVVKTFPTSLLFAAKADGGIVENGRFDVLYTGWIGGIDPDDAALWTCDQIPPGGSNWSFACDRRIDQQEAIALSSYDLSVRRRAYWRIQELLAEDVPVKFLVWSTFGNAVRDGLAGYASPPTASDFANTWQWSMR